MQVKNNNIYTTAPIRSVMLKTALSMLPGTLAMSGYNIADTYFVGQLPGASPLAAMGFTFPVIMFLGCIFRGLASGVMTISAQALGAQKLQRASRLVSTGILFIVLFSIFIAILGITSAKHIFSLFGAKGETLILVNSYMTIWYFGCMTASLSMTGNSLLIAAGDSKMASSAMILGMVINIILDPLFIFGWEFIPGMGIQGAALATVLSQLISSVFVIGLLYYKFRLLRFEYIPWRVMKHAWRLIIIFGIPATLAMLMMPLGAAIVTRITAEFGDAAVAATGAAARIEMVAFVVPMSLGMSLMPFFGQNYGARLYDRIREGRRFAMRFAIFFLICSATVITLFNQQIVSFFTADTAVQEIMSNYLIIVSWGLWAVEIHRFAGFVYTGCGRPAAAAWLNALRIAGLLIPFSLVAFYYHSLTLLFIARLAADVCAGIIAYCLARRMTSKLLQ